MTYLGKSNLIPKISHNYQQESDQRAIYSTNVGVYSNNKSSTPIFQLSHDIPEVNIQLNQTCQLIKKGNIMNKKSLSNNSIQKETLIRILSQMIHDKIFDPKFIEPIYKYCLFKEDENESNKDYSKYKYKKFSQEEDEMIKRSVTLFGAKNWRLIASMIPGRTPRQCRDRYANYLAPGFIHTEWSAEEDNLLAEKFKIYGPKWTQMMQFFPYRTANDIKNRFNYTVSRIMKLNNQENQNILIDNQIHDVENVQVDDYLEDDQNQLCYYNEYLQIGEYDFTHMNEQFP